MERDLTTDFNLEIAKTRAAYLGVLPGEIKRHAIYRLSLLGYTYRQIQIVVYVSLTAISEVISQIRNTGKFTESPPAKIGCPQKVTQEIINRITAMTDENPRIIGDIEISQIYLGYVRLQSILHEIKLAFKYLPLKKKSLLTDEQIHKRMIYGYSLYNSNIDFSTLLF